MLSLCLLLFPTYAQAEVNTSTSYEKFVQENQSQAKGKIALILNQYCGNSCQYIDTQIEVDEKDPEDNDLGFEGLGNETDKKRTYFVSRLTVEIQIDQRVSTKDRERLGDLLSNQLKSIGPAKILWSSIEFPKIDDQSPESEELKTSLERRVRTATEDLIQSYCPDACILSHIQITGKTVTGDQASRLPALEVVSSSSKKSFFQVEAVDIGVSLDEKLDEKIRSKILAVLKAKTQFVRPVHISVDIVPFPETYSARQEKKQAESLDPYGLERLQKMLTLFRDLAGTKEIISKSSSESTSDTKDRITSSNSQEEGDKKWFIYIIILLLVGGFVAFMILRFANAGKDAQFMMHAIKSKSSFEPSSVPAEAYESSPEPKRSGLGSSGSGSHQDLRARFRLDAMREELLKSMFESPTVAQATFGRMLQENGVEETAQYIQILGKTIVLELFNDPSLYRDLYELSEYCYKNELSISMKEEEKLLFSLKNKLTANEIRSLTQKGTEHFNFLNKLDAGQIFTLVTDEQPRTQSIVLTQLPPLQRRSVFNLYQGEKRVELLKELCKSDAIPKEYLANVGRALQKKVFSRPEFDTQNLRTSEVLLELLERSSLKEQRDLMHRLAENNPDGARSIKLKLVTIEMLPFFKDGHLLELVLGMSREDLLSFLVGSKSHIRELLLSHAPRELAESWMEDMESINSVDEEQYRIAELKILARIRALAASGAISLLDINDMIFSGNGSGRREEQDLSGKIDRRNVLA
ncbi:MAG: hypothetical protein KA436_06020 [Oligoflexales bacterium]|nr:hypothetical protein [Oligoflexales bacterium]